MGLKNAGSKNRTLKNDTQSLLSIYINTQAKTGHGYTYLCTCTAAAVSTVCSKYIQYIHTIAHRAEAGGSFAPRFLLISLLACFFFFNHPPFDPYVQEGEQQHYLLIVISTQPNQSSSKIEDRSETSREIER